MKLFKKLFAIVLCLALVLGAVPMMVSAADDYDNIPAMVESEGMFVIQEGEVASGYLGSGAVSNGCLPNSGFEYISISTNPTNFQNYDYFEFDFYVENLVNFKARTSSLTIELYRIGSGSKIYDFLNLLTKDGWNHVKITIDKSETSYQKRTGRFIFHITMSEDSASANDVYRVANVAATYKVDEYNIIPTIVESEGMLKMHEGSTRSGTYANFTDPLGGNYTNNSVIDFSKYSYIEFDFYADNANDLKALLSEFTFNFWQSDSKQLGLDFLDQITQDGWNHVKLAISKNSGVALNNIKYYRFRPTKIADASVDTSSRYNIANVCATLDAIDLVPGIVANQITIHEGKIFSNKYGTPTATGINKYPAAGDQNITVADDKKDFTVGDYVEFDYFVDDVVALKEKLTGIHINLIASGNNNGSWVNFIDQITANGWNHIKIEMDDLKYYGNGGYLTMSNVQHVRFRVAFAESALNVEFADRYAIANVCVTKDIVIPTDVMKEKVDFIGAEFKEIVFGAYGYSEDITADITNTRMIELDVYVENDSNSTIGIEIGDAEGVFAYYEFENLTNGWNHLAVRIDDMDGADELDKANITNFALYGVEGTTVHVSNFYAANYIDGDANRDGVLDLKDVVRAKKLFAGLTTEGNKLAVTSDDYIIDAVDITSLSNIVLAELFK